MSTFLSSWTLRKKLLVAFLFSGLVPLLSAGFIVTKLFDEAIEDASYSQLETVRAVKQAEIKDYFQTISNQIQALSESTMTVFAMKTFKKSFHSDKSLKKLSTSEGQAQKTALIDFYKNQFGKEFEAQNNQSIDVESLIPTDPMEIYRQYRYIASNENPLGSKDALDHAPMQGETYDRIHKKYHPAFRSFLHKFEFYEIFLIDPDTGHIVYSVLKGLDYATSLKTGPYRDSNFAQVFKDAAESANAGDVAFQDFKTYRPSYDAAASFIASPIYDGLTLEGVLVFQMPVGRISEIMGTTAGLGESGTAYLVGPDGLMRSQVRGVEENAIGKVQIDSETFKKALAGQTGYEIITDEFGNEKLSSYAPIELFGLTWAVLAEIDKSEAFVAETLIHTSLGIIGVVAILFVLLVTFFVVRSVLRQLGGDPAEIQSVADSIAENDLEIELKSPDESTGVYSAMSKMRDNLRQSIEQDRKVANENSRVKQALDNVSTNVMVADADNNIIYLNDAVSGMFRNVESDIQKDLPTFSAANLMGSNIDIFHKNPAHQQQLVKNLKSAHHAEFIIGGRTMKFTANPIINGQSERLGTVVEWVDRTDEVAIQNDVEALISKAQNGDLGDRLDLQGKEGFFLNLSSGMNQLIDTMSQVLGEIASVMSEMSQGNLNSSMNGEHQGTFAEVQNNINSTIESIRDIVDNIRISTDLITTGSDEISSGNNSLSTRTEQQAASLEETASAMEELTSTVRQNADNAQQANQLADSARETAKSGGDIVGNAVKAMAEINTASKKIAEIVGVIDEIAFQTNLLALNASVEAARAGEQGRGFAVVATEVRNLAQRSATSAKEIKNLIQDSVVKVDAGASLVNQSGEALQEIVTSVMKVGDIVAEIATASMEQATGIDQVNKTITNLDDLTQQNAALAEETSAASVSMNQHAREMSSQVEFFSLGSSAAGTVHKPSPAPSAQRHQPTPSSRPVNKASQGGSAATQMDDDDDWAEF
ncbi:MAG: methyl-accepting chemotaxis protein [Gammaproteobacteria bacterium]|jgi:methyl-accepting chemotaxis protein